MSVPAWRP